MFWKHRGQTAKDYPTNLAHLVKPQRRSDRLQGSQDIQENETLEPENTAFEYVMVYLDKNPIGDAGARHLSEARLPVISKF